MKIKGSTRQMSPRWIEDRILELERMGQRNKEIRRLAGRLNQALFSGNFEAYSIVTDRTGEVRPIVNHTQEWKDSYLSKGIEIRPQRSVLPQTSTPGRPSVPPRRQAMGKGRTRVVDTPPKRFAGTLPGDVRGTWNRLGGGPVSGIENPRGIANPISSGAVRRSATRTLARRGLRSASTFVFSRLAGVVLKVLPLLDIIGILLDVIGIIGAIISHYREKAIKEAFLRGLKKDIPDAIGRSLEKKRDAIARHYVAEWNKKQSSALFLYLSPRVEIYNATARYRSDYNFKTSLEVKNLTADLISTRFIEFKRQDIQVVTEEDYWIGLRWSLPQPLFTPFDIFLARIELIAEIVVDDWLRLYIEQDSVDSNLVRAFYDVIQICAKITATLKYEAYFGFAPSDREFRQDLTELQRWEHLQELVSLIRKKLIPKLRNLLRKRAIDSEESLPSKPMRESPVSRGFLFAGGTWMQLCYFYAYYRNNGLCQLSQSVQSRNMDTLSACSGSRCRNLNLQY